MTEATLSADKPIENRDDDALGYWPFAQAIAQGIVGRAPTDGFVLGLQAQWGMGKTSAVNLILQAVGELEVPLAEDHRTRVQWFNPWLFAGVDALARGYLNQLGGVIAASLDQTLSRKSRRFLAKLAKGGSEFIGGAAALGVVAATGGAAIPLAASVKSGVSGAVSLGSHVAESRTLDALAESMRRELQQLPHKILIILDDLDRLEPQELKQVLTLVKTFGNLPQVTHLLVYDRKILDFSLRSAFGEEAEGKRAPTFLEKIVQVEFDLPPPSRAGLIRLLNDRISDILGDGPGTADDNWFQVWQVGYTHYLHSPRDIVRFTNSLSVVWPSVAGEVYAPDFIAVELLRHFERSTYDLIRQDSEFLTGHGLIMGDEARKERAELLLSAVPKSRKEDVKELIRRMFPVVSKYLSGFGLGLSAQDIVAGRPIHTREGFDTYFRLSPAPDELTMVEIREIEDNIANGPFLRDQFASSIARLQADGTSFAANLLDELAEIIGRQEEIGAAPVNALLEFGDQLLMQKDLKNEFFFPTSNDRRVARLAGRMLPRLPVGQRGQILKDAIARQESGISVSAFLIAEAALPYQLIYNTDREAEAHLTEDEVRELGSLLVDKIRSAAAAGDLAYKSELWMLLKSWKVFGDPAEVHQWVIEALGNPASALPVILSTMGRISYKKEGEERGIDSLPDPEIYEKDELLRLAKELAEASETSPRDLGDLKRFIRFVEAHTLSGPDAISEGLEVS